ncbi:fungal-specific transcription factor domain-containing protein [Geopyxis carbonaria]|nr:fungal-specific transcription factor domain-containing protein [Geopyxis carbonaria]
MNPPSPPLPPPSPAASTRTRKRVASSSTSSSPKIPPPTTPHATFSLPPARPKAAGTSASISRSISACNRCRVRKTKCDQLFPSCTACLRANVECVGIDAATGREIPRSYVDWLEKRVKHLEGQLIPQNQQEGIGGGGTPQESERSGEERRTQQGEEAIEPCLRQQGEGREEKREDKALHLRPDIENLIDQVGLVGVQGTSAPGFMGTSSGISFARLMFAAVKMQSKDNNSQQNSGGAAQSPMNHIGTPDTNPPPDPSISSTTIPRGRHRATPINFPKRQQAEYLMDIFFQQANPQFPILHRPTFENIFRRVCDRVERDGGSTYPPQQGNGHELYPESIQHSADLYFSNMCFAIASAMSQNSENLPERYHATAMLHMDCLFSSISLSNNRLDGLKGVLLLAVYSMMRPAAPGVWYVLGSSLRLAIDLGLHQENTPKAETLWDPLALDERRRLFWCTYSIDRQVCVYLGRPFGISDDAVKTPYPIDVSDEYITPSGIMHPPPGTPSSRAISLHMFRIRQLQSEIQQILYQSSAVPRRFSTLESWRHDMEQRLTSWCDTVPKTRSAAGCSFNLSFIDLNYQQTRLLLHGLSPAVPMPSESSFAIIADSGSRIIRAYRHLHHEKSINYTWLACHNLFMAGTSYLCALWHSPAVRRTTTLDEIDFNTLACVNVLASMVARCSAAQACRDVFETLATRTVQLCNSEYTAGAGAPDERARKRVKTSASESPAATLSPEHDGAGGGGGDMWAYPAPAPASAPPPAPPASLANLLSPPYDHFNAPPPQEYGVGQGMVDGRGLFEMIQEVGAAGGGWGVDSPGIGSVGVGGMGVGVAVGGMGMGAMGGYGVAVNGGVPVGGVWGGYDGWSGGGGGGGGGGV